ncbi:MAG: winged helix-turn-helix domain-containing protein [Pyrinomonadaceae bacterium]
METPDANRDRTSADGDKYVFDAFEIDAANRTLVRAGIEVPVTARVFDVLLVFAENPGRLLEKEELIEKVWHEDFVEEGNLARNVSMLRKALGDSGKGHKYIVTVQGHGYRFVADVRRIGAIGPAQTSDRADAATTGATAGGRVWLITIGVFVLAGSVGILLYAGLSGLIGGKAIDLSSVRQTKLTQDGNVVSPAISQDGQYLAYVCLKDGGHGICVRQIATGDVLQVVEPSPGVSRWGSSISSDNKFVYYISMDEGSDRGVLYRVSLFGGVPQKLIENVSGYSLSPGGSRLVFSRSNIAERSTTIAVTDGEPANETVLVSAELETVVYSMDWSPDDKSILYSIRRQTSDGEARYVAEVPAAGGAEKRIPNPTEAKIASVRWMPDRKGFVGIVLDETTNSPQLYYISYPGGTLSRLTNDVNGHDAFSMTADGRTIVTGEVYDNRQIWAGFRNDLNDLRPITSDTEKHFDTVDWAGNDYLVSDEDENSGYRIRNIWRMRPDGGKRQQLTQGGSNNSEPTVSADGKVIVFVSNRSGKSQLWKMSIDGTGLTRLTDVAENISSPQWSDGENAVYFRAWKDGLNELWRVPADGGDAKRIVTGVDVRAFAVSPDGSQIAIACFDRAVGKVQTRLRSVPGQFDDRLLEFVPETWMAWSSDGRSIYFNRAADAGRNVWRQQMDRTRGSPATNFEDPRVYHCAWSSDGSGTACIRQQITFDAVMIRL